MSKLENGSGVKATLFINGKLVDFKLALVRDKRYSFTTKKLTFLSDDNRMADGFYSGGTTGFGRRMYDIIQLPNDDYEIISTDLGFIMDDLNKEEDQEKNRVKEFNQKQIERCKKINDLPKKEHLFFYKGMDFYIKRSEAEYNPRISSSVKPYYSIINPTWKGDHRIWVDVYVSKDNKLLVKKFTNDLNWLFGEKKNEIDSRELLTLLLNAEKVYKLKIREILNS